MANEAMNYISLIEKSPKFQNLKAECQSVVKLSLTGITNLVVNYEDPSIVDCFLNSCFSVSEVYHGARWIDAVELQKGMPGRGYATQFLDELIFGTYELEGDGKELGAKVPKTDPKTGKRMRNRDGFVWRKEVMKQTAQDKLLIIKNIDYCMDFCSETPGKVDARNLWLFDNFRNPSVKMRCRMLLVTNEPLKFPFKIRTLRIDPVDEFEAKCVVDSFKLLFDKKGMKFSLNDTQEKQIIRKLCGSTYTEAGDAIAEASSKAFFTETKEIDASKIVKNLREKINRNLMEEACGLTHLAAKPWEDYICPEASNFTYDVKKIIRDFNEINRLKEIDKDKLKKKEDDSPVINNIESIRSRMPHVIVLYGKGGVGKSAFPIHFAGLLDFDVWDFNVNALHNMYIGQSGERTRDALGRISKASHLVVRIDEYDRAIGSTASNGQDMHAAHKQVETEIMNWLQNSQEDNLFIKSDIFIVLTTNHKENITGPLLRSGRADLVIDISEFDDKSMQETFKSASRRMKNRGLFVPAGFSSFEDLAKAIERLDLSKLTPLAAQKGFTVRDIDTLIIEMAAHNYYFKKYNNGIPWCTDTFVKVLENSTGSTVDENTNELTLGDRFLTDEKKQDPQLSFDFLKDYATEYDPEKFKEISFFK